MVPIVSKITSGASSRSSSDSENWQRLLHQLPPQDLDHQEHAVKPASQVVREEQGDTCSGPRWRP